MLSARCDLARSIPSVDSDVYGDDVYEDHEEENGVDAVGGTQDDELWSYDESAHADVVLMASCASVEVDTDGSGGVEARDCVNGTLMPKKYFPDGDVNYTTVHRVFQDLGSYFPLDRQDMKIPFESEIVIYNKTRLLINTEACVNTLQYECTEFYLDHRRDGRNYTARDRYPCYYTPKSGEFATARFSLSTTRYVFFLFFSVPAGLWVLSCSCLFGCSKLLRVEEGNGQMRIRCRKSLTQEEREPPKKPKRTRSRSASLRRSRRAAAMAKRTSDDSFNKDA